MTKYWLVYYNGYCLNDVYNDNDDEGYQDEGYSDNDDEGYENENVNFAELVYCKTKEAAINHIANKL